MFVNSDFSDLLRIFNDNGVKYLVIGGYAVIQDAEPRFTKDLDLWISTDTANAAAVYRSLQEFGALPADLAENDFAEEGYFYQMDVPPERRTEVKFDDLPVTFISRQDLITAKRASGRPQDVIDADLLSQPENE